MIVSCVHSHPGNEPVTDEHCCIHSFVDSNAMTGLRDFVTNTLRLLQLEREAEREEALTLQVHTLP